MKKLLLAFMFLPVFVGASTEAPADMCQTTNIYTEIVDFSDSRINVDYTGRNTITVGAQTGYAITQVDLDVVGDDQEGYFTYATSSVDNLNPDPGGDIISARVTVLTDCTDPVEPPTATSTPPVIDPTDPGTSDSGVSTTTQSKPSSNEGGHRHPLVTSTSGSSTTTVESLEVRRALIIQAIDLLNKLIAMLQAQQVTYLDAKG